MSAITKAGVYDMPAEEYHADPALSSSGARRLLPPSCPALFRYYADHGQEPTAAFDIGHAAHSLVLGNGPELHPMSFDDYRSAAAKAERDEARARGAVPLKSEDWEQVHGMAAALREHKVASALLNLDKGVAEQSLFWQDPKTGVWLRARPDWMPVRKQGRYFIVTDYKTTRHSDRDRFAKSVAEYGYHNQAAWYLDGIRALGLAGDEAVFVFIAQEKTPPYLVGVHQIDEQSLNRGRVQNRYAIDLFHQCTTTGRWPGYSDEVELIGLPVWAAMRIDEAEDAGNYQIKEAS